jgi:alkylation response protein AidB-like acyl-CoA dehydrogenase
VLVGAVLPALGRWRAPARRQGGHVVVDGLVLTPQDRMLVVTQDGEGIVVDDALDVCPVRGLDSSLGLHSVRGEIAAVEDAQSVEWSSTVVRAQLAISHELIGASRSMLELARTHALEREQFGRPIAMFQAVRHRLAEALIAIETAEAALDAAWLDGSPVFAAMAKAVAGRGARTTARHCQQVLAGIGFTTEHPLHRYVRRVVVLDQLFGSSKLLTKELGDTLLASRRLPPLLPL